MPTKSQNPKINTVIILNNQSKSVLKNKELNEFIHGIYDAQDSEPRVDFLGPSVNGSWDINIKEHFGKWPQLDHFAQCERYITISEFIQKKNICIPRKFTKIQKLHFLGTPVPAKIQQWCPKVPSPPAKKRCKQFCFFNATCYKTLQRSSEHTTHDLKIHLQRQLWQQKRLK